MLIKGTEEGECVKIIFRRKSKSEWLTLFVLIMPFAFFLLMDLLHLPSAVKYVVDIGWICLLAAMLFSKKNLPNLQSKNLAKIAGAFFLLTLLGFFANYQSVFYYLWGLRNNARFFVFFFACIIFLRAISIEYYLRFFDWLLWINIPVVLYQYFVMGKSQDFLGGIFGVGYGCNGYMNIFLVIIMTRSVLRYMTYKEPLIICLAKCAASLLITILSELKIFIFELALIVLMASAMTKFSIRKLWIILGSVVGVFMAAQIIAILFPDFADWFNLDRILYIISSESGYTSTDDLNRLTAVPIIWNEFLPSGWYKLFGLGLGNCDYASFDFLTTPFYMTYKRLNYVWFSSAYLLLETGLVGMVMYVLFYVSVYFGAVKRQKLGLAPSLYCQMARILAVICVVMIIYNSAMRAEPAYMMYFVLALPFVSSINGETGKAQGIYKGDKYRT